MPAMSRLRTRAFHKQEGRCLYCGWLMWLSSPTELAGPGLRPRTVVPLQCTAEHLVAKQSGGSDHGNNIAAACWLCNQRRHKRKSPPSPEAYRALVQKRIAKGKWHSPAVARLRVKSLSRSLIRGTGQSPPNLRSHAGNEGCRV